MSTTRKFHINHDGDVRLCKAEKRICEFEANGGHFDDPREARAVAEAKFESQYSLRAQQKIQKQERKATKGLERTGVISLEELRIAMSSGERYLEIGGVPMPLRKDRLQLFMRDELKCVKCGLAASFAAGERVRGTERNCHLNVYGTRDGKDVLFTKDHILPKSQGGPNKLDNYQIMCQPCNEQKGNSNSQDLRGAERGRSKTIAADVALEKKRREVLSQAQGILKAINREDEWLPPVDDPSAPSDGSVLEEDGYIKSMDQLREPRIAAGNCILVAESVLEFNRNRKLLANLSVVHQEVEGPNLNVHYANQFRDPEGKEWAIDYSYSQVDPQAAFPHVAPLEDWRKAVAQAGQQPISELQADWKATR